MAAGRGCCSGVFACCGVERLLGAVVVRCVGGDGVEDGGARGSHRGIWCFLCCLVCVMCEVGVILMS